jgi:Carboxypeptidase regulatory-like domain
MSADRIPAPRRARLRACVAACIRSQRGDTLIEVLIGALMVALIAAATFTGYIAIVHVSGDQRDHSQADALAQQDQARLHGLTLDALGSSLGNQTYAVSVHGVTYQVISSSQFVSGGGSGSCTTSGTSSADEVQTTSTVWWGLTHTAHQSVTVRGLVAPQAGGSLVVRVIDSASNPVTGANIALSGGPSSATPLVTDAAGCAVFGGLNGGSYTVTATKTGWVTPTQAPSAVVPNLTVVPSQTANANLTLSQAGGVTASFTTNYNGLAHVSSADQAATWTVGQPTQYNVFGTAGTGVGAGNYQTTLNSGLAYYPASYTVFAGTCAGDYLAGASGTAVITAGATTSVTIPQPALLVMVWTGTSSASKGSLITTAPVVTLTDTNSGCSGENYPATVVPTLTQGALADPGQVAGNLTVCASASIAGTVYHNTAAVANTAVVGGTTANIYLGSGASGRVTGVCT